MPIPPASCRWPGCLSRAKSHGFCPRELGRLQSLGFTPAEVTDDQIPALVEAWDARQAARVLPTATHVGETPAGSWETPAPFTTGSFAPGHSTAEEALAEHQAGPTTLAFEAPSPTEVAGDTPPAPAANDPLTDAFGRLLFGAARYAGVTVDGSSDVESVTALVLAGLRDLNDRANQRDELQAEVGRLTRDLAAERADRHGLAAQHGSLLTLLGATPPADGAECQPTFYASVVDAYEGRVREVTLESRRMELDRLRSDLDDATREKAAALAALAERTQDLEVVHGILQDAVPPAHMHWPTTAIARTLIDQCATFRSDLQSICTALDVTVPAAVLPVLREWSADRMRGADAEKLLHAIDDALRGAGIDTEVHPHLDGIERLRSQRDAAQAQLDAGGPAPSSGLVLSPREVTAIGLALDAVLACNYDHQRPGIANVIRAIVGLSTGKAS